MSKMNAEIILAILAIFGGIARYLDLYLKGTEQILLARFAASIFVSAFSGYMTAQIIILVAPTWVYIAAGIGGYASTKFLDMFVDLVKKKFGG